MPQRTRRSLSVALFALALTAALGPTARAMAEPPGCVEAQKPDSPQTTTVNVNTATAAELEQLPRIGPKKAVAIVEARARLGGFKRPSQLLRVKGIGRATLRRLLPLIRLRDAPAASDGPSSKGTPGSDPVP